ncbi:MAG: DUF4412 domain-containing protein [Bacteroidales bacterium]|nr:DUF4412 domain-containing protein [Bacteroidales bacterium]
MIKYIITILAIILFINVSVGQNLQNFEGETTARVYKNIKTSFTQTGGDLMLKLLMKAMMKRFVGNNPDVNYNGSYDEKRITKDGKLRVEASYNNSVTIEIPVEDNQIKTIVYYPFIKKGYSYYRDLTIGESNRILEENMKGDVENAGTMTVMGRKCNVYKVKYSLKTDTLATESDINIHNEFAICSDSDLPPSDEVLPGVKGFPLKFTTNNVTQSVNKSSSSFTMDIMYSISTEIKSVNPRHVDDSEFEVPSDIKMAPTGKHIMKIVYENRDYMMKKGLWNQLAEDNDKIYDNLADDWDF